MVPADLILPEHVTAFSALMRKKTGSSVFDRNTRASFDQAIAFAKAIGAPNPEAYLKSYAFTLGRIIWYPFDVEKPEAIGNWTLPWQLITIAHEHVHVRQWDAYQGPPFASDYVLDSEARAMRWEAEAYTTTLELAPLLYGFEPDVVPIANGLTAYGCLPGDIRGALRVLQVNQGIVRRGGIINPESRELISFLRTAQILPPE